jgi:hypothetical protein
MQPTEREWLAWATVVGRSIGALADDLAMRAKRSLCGPILCRVSRLELGRILEPAPSDRWLEARHVAIGQELELFFLSAEPAAEYASIVVRALPGAWTIGYLGDVFGYLPTDEQILQGGYEVEGFRELFGLSGRFIGRNNAVVAELIARLDVSSASIEAPPPLSGGSQ